MKSPKAQEHHDGIAQEPETPTEAARDDAGPRKTYKTLRFEGFFCCDPSPLQLPTLLRQAKYLEVYAAQQPAIAGSSSRVPQIFRTIRKAKDCLPVLIIETASLSR